MISPSQIVDVIRRNLFASSLMLLSLANTVLIAAFLYVVLPQYDSSMPKRDMMEKLPAIAQMTDADVINIWKISVLDNTREFVTSHIKNVEDEDIVYEFQRNLLASVFTKSVQTEAALSIISGHVYCEDVTNVEMDNKTIHNFKNTLKIRTACWVPVLSERGRLVGYTALLWKNVIPYNDAIIRAEKARAIINAK